MHSPQDEARAWHGLHGREADIMHGVRRDG